MSDEIVVHPETVQRWGWMFVVPREKSSDPNFVKHVRCEGASFHVLSYDTNGVHCSEPECIINKE
jgi:hypothetical protein